MIQGSYFDSQYGSDINEYYGIKLHACAIDLIWN